MTRGAIIQTLSEFGPVLAFFISGQLLPFTQAVLVLVVSTLLSLLISWIHNRRIPVLPLFSGILVLLTGTITIYLDIPGAIIFADTIYFWGLAAAISVGFYQPRHFLERVFDETFAVRHEGWRIISLQWLILLVLAGFANEFVRLFMTPEFWIDYKFTKVLFISTFSTLQIFNSRKYRIVGTSNKWGFKIR